MRKIVLGLDIGSNSIGFSLLELNENTQESIFKELNSNSIIFSEPNDAKDRREARSARRRNERKSTRNKNVRKIFTKYNITSNDFIKNTTNYLNSFNLLDNDVYNIREKAVFGTKLTKEEFILSTYSILTHRGYNNMFSISGEDGVINEAVTHNSKEYREKNYPLPSTVLTNNRKNLEETYQNIPIRNKKDDYRNSLERDMHEEEFRKVVLSQSDNTEIFSSLQQCQRFIDEIIEVSFFQRPLKSFEDMVEYCSFYNKFNPKGAEKKVPLSNIKNIELTLRQDIDNYQILNKKTGEILLSKEVLKRDDIDKIVDFWIKTPNVDKINNKNIFKNPGYKDLKIHTKDDKELLILDISGHRKILKILNQFDVDFQDKDSSFYDEILQKLYYFKNTSSRVEHINRLIREYKLNLDSEFTEQIALLTNMDGFAAFSLKFTNELLEIIKTKNRTFHESLEDLGYYSRYLNMPIYEYLPPLDPTKADIKWLKKNIPYFQENHLFYQPQISPKVKRVISVLRKLINELIKKHGKIDEIRVETAKELNSKKEKEQINENQSKERLKNNEAIKLLKNKGYRESSKNIEIGKLWKEQGGKCLYSGEPISEDEAFDENETEIEHFIPRSVIWINSYKNKILVKKKHNQNKGSKHPINYLKSVGQWENFQERVERTFMVSNKKNWLIDEEIINSVMEKEHWQESYLNDTRSATRIIQKYISHYLYPKENVYGKGEKRSVFSVTGKAINELKYMWGIHTVIPKDENNKKDRNTNYHHTLDAFTIALCSSRAINTLHSYFKKKENKFKIKALKEELKNRVPKSEDGVSVVEYLKDLVKKYENNKLYVCPFNKQKTNMKGFKDGNLKLYITKDPKDETKEILSEIEKVAVDKSILFKKVGLNFKDRTDKEVKFFVKSLQDRLDPIKQKSIIKSLDVYSDELLELRNQLFTLDKEIKDLKKTLKTGKQHKEHNDEINKEIKPFQLQKESLSKEIQEKRCSFPIKNGKRQIVRSLKLYKIKIEQSKADAIIFQDKIERLSVSNFREATKNKKPFVTKMNESTLNVHLFNTKKRGQAVGLNYFSGIANNIGVKINDRYLDEINPSQKPDLVLYKNDIIKVSYLKDNTEEYYVFNGGGNITGSNNKLSIKNINMNSFIKVNKKGDTKEQKEDNISPSNTIIVSKGSIDFFGNIQ